MNPSQIAITMAALRQAAVLPGSPTPTAPPLAPGQLAGCAPRGALPSRAGAGNMAGIVDVLNRAHGLQPGANPAGPFVAANRPATRGRGVSRPHELADKVNAEAGLRPGANVSPEFAARFAAMTEETV